MTILAHKDGNRIQTLTEHSYNVACLARDEASTINQGHVLFLLGLYHDLGKADRKFQEKLTDKPDMHVDHSYAGARYLFSQIKETINYSPFTDIIAYVIATHHGLFDIYKEQDPGNNHFYKRLTIKEGYHFNEDILNYAKILEQSLPKYGYQNLKDLLQKAHKEYTTAWQKLYPKDNIEKTYYEGCLMRLYLSYLKNADILDTINAYETIIEPTPKEKQDQYKKHYLTAIENIYESFQNPTTNINKLRTKLAVTVKERGQTDNAGIYRLNLPTGAGKTNLSMRYAFHQLGSKNKKRFVYMAPFLSILEQNASAIRQIVGNDGVTEHHSNIETSTVNDTTFSRYTTDTWDDQIILTTTVQYFQTLFKPRANNIRRFANLSNSVIILDEVQSLPITVTYLFNLMSNFMTAIMQTTLVLCTATQPSYDFSALKHQINYHKNADIATMTPDERHIFERTTITKAKDDDSFTDLETIKNNIINTEKPTLVIFNTKKTVDSLYQSLKETTSRPLYHLSTNMCAEHRLTLLKEIKNKLTKKEPLIVISTQLIEAGVDVDFEYVIRSYAGIDSLVQANGRCNREGHLEKGNMLLVNLSSEDENLNRLPDIKHKKTATKNVLHGLSFQKGNTQGFTQIHGHRHTDSTEHSICLEDNVEYGGNLCVLHITENGHSVQKYANTVFRIPQTDTESDSAAKPWIEDTENQTTNSMIRNKHIRVKSLDHNLYSLNFTSRAFEKGIWDTETVKARGLFVDQTTGEIKMRSYNKFFAIGEQEETQISNLKKSVKFPLIAHKKYNGFLGIASTINGEFVLATKSTTEGEYVDYFREIFEQLSQKEKDQLKDLSEKYDCSFTFEVEHTSDRHIIDFDKNSLTILDAIPNSFEFDGIDIDSAFSNNVLDQLEITSLFFKRKEVIATFNDIPTLMRYIKEHDYDRDSEGLVLTDQNGFMFKVKYAYYREVKRLRGLHENAIKSLRTSTAIKLNKAFTDVQVRFLNWLRDKDNAYIFETHIIDIFRDFEKDCGKQL